MPALCSAGLRDMQALSRYSVLFPREPGLGKDTASCWWHWRALSGFFQHSRASLAGRACRLRMCGISAWGMRGREGDMCLVAGSGVRGQISP